MIVKNSKKEKNTVTFDVELDPAEFEKCVNGAYLKSRGKIAVPGFRKGKAPRMVIEGMYGKEVFYDEAIQDCANDAFTYGVDQEKLKTVGAPAMEDAKVTDEKGVVLSFKTDVYPEVTLGQYKGLEAVKANVEVTEEEINADIERARKQNARRVSVERPAEMGDVVMLDYCGKLDGVAFDGGTAQNQELLLGSKHFVPGFEEQLVGLSVGDEKDINITFPEDYHKDLAGKAVVFSVKINDIKHEELPEVDDEFAKDNDFDTLADMKADIKKRLTEQKTTAAENAFKDAVVDAAAANMTVDIPESMVEERMDNTIREYAQYMASQGMRFEDYLKMMGTDAKSFRESTRGAAEKQTRTEILLTAVVEAEKIEAGEDEVNAELERMGKNYGMSAEDVAKAVNMDLLKAELNRNKAVDFIAANAIAKAPEETKAE